MGAVFYIDGSPSVIYNEINYFIIKEEQLMPLYFQYGDITKLTVDAVVNAANEKLLPGGGVCGAIFQAAGPQLEQACSQYGRCAPGQVVITPGFALPAKYIIHTVGPVWQGGEQGEAELLAACYKNAILLAAEKNCTSIAFPLISSGIFGYPPAKALEVAVTAIREALYDYDLKAILVFLDKRSFALPGEVLDAAATFMKDRALEMAFEDTTFRHTYRMIRRAGFGHMPGLEMPVEEREQLQQEFAQDDTFSSALAKMMVARDLTVKELSRKSNLSTARLTSFLKGQMPSKAQAMAVAMGMELELTYARQLLATARLFLDATEDQDLLVEYCMINGKYDTILANQLLFAMYLPQLIW